MNNIKKLQTALSETQLDALLLISSVNIRYATGFPHADGGALITRDRAFLLTDSRYIEAAQRSVTEAEVLLVDNRSPLTVRLEQLLVEHNIETLGTEEHRLSFADWKHYSERLPAQLVPVEGLLNELRAVKSPEEKDCIVAAQRIAERAFDDILGIIKPGLSEREIAAELTYRMLKYGGEGNSFDPIVVTGAKSSMPHGVPGDELIKSGDFVTLDFGCIKNGYCSDMTRTVAVGSADDEMRLVYSVVARAQEAGIAAAKPGVIGSAVHAAAAKVIADAGYGEYFGHGFGHSVGLEIHEGPNASPRETRPLPEGDVLTAEPGIYLLGRFGVRIEDMLYLTGDGCENLTLAPKQLIIL